MRYFSFVGILLCIISFVMLLGVMYEAYWEPHHYGGADFSTVGTKYGGPEESKVEVLRLKSGRLSQSRLLQVDTKRACRIEVRVSLYSTKIYPKKNYSKDELMLKYAYPLVCTVWTEGGKPIINIDQELTHNTSSSPIRYAPVKITDMPVIHDFGKFRIPRPGRIHIDAHLGSDRKFGSVAYEAQLMFFYNLPHRKEIIRKAAILGIIGVAILAFSFFRFKNVRSAENLKKE